MVADPVETFEGTSEALASTPSTGSGTAASVRTVNSASFGTTYLASEEDSGQFHSLEPADASVFRVSRSSVKWALLMISVLCLMSLTKLQQAFSGIVNE